MSGSSILFLIVVAIACGTAVWAIAQRIEKNPDLTPMQKFLCGTGMGMIMMASLATVVFFLGTQP